MAVNIQTDTSLVNNYADNQNAFNNAYDTTTKRLDAIQTGREKATINKLYGESLNSDGTLDTNKLTQGMASTGLGANIPALLQQKQEQELNGLKLGKAKIDQSLSHLGIIGQVMGSVTNKDEYNKGLSTLQEQGVDVSKYPQVTTDEEAKKNASFASNNAISASDKVANDYKNSELFTRLQKYQTELETANKKQEWEQSKFAQSDATTRRGQDMTAKNRNTPTPYQQDMLAEKQDKRERESTTKKAEIEQQLGNAQATLGRTQALLNNPALSKVGVLSNALGSVTSAVGYPTEVGSFQNELNSKIEEAKLVIKAEQKGTQTDKDELNIAKSLIAAQANKDPVALKKALEAIADREQRAVTKNKTVLDSFGSSNVSSKPTIQSLVDKLPSGVSEVDKADYIEHLKAKGLQ